MNGRADFPYWPTPDELADALDAANAEVARLRAEKERFGNALLIIANKAQCLDNLMGDKDIALAVLRGRDG